MTFPSWKTHTHTPCFQPYRRCFSVLYRQGKQLSFTIHPQNSPWWLRCGHLVYIYIYTHTHTHTHISQISRVYNLKERVERQGLKIHWLPSFIGQAGCLYPKTLLGPPSNLPSTHYSRIHTVRKFYYRRKNKGDGKACFDDEGLEQFLRIVMWVFYHEEVLWLVNSLPHW